MTNAVTLTKRAKCQSVLQGAWTEKSS